MEKHPDFLEDIVHSCEVLEWLSKNQANFSSLATNNLSGQKELGKTPLVEIKNDTVHVKYDDIVYDFEVDDNDHLLTAGVFLVHNSPFEGGRIQFFAAHWFPRMRWRARDRMLWGEDFDKMSEFEKFYKRQ